MTAVMPKTRLIHKTQLQEYDFETDKLLFVPGDWNTQRPQLYYYEGTVWYRKHFEYSLQPGKRLFLNLELLIMKPLYG